jgi:hypothetical protein
MSEGICYHPLTLSDSVPKDVIMVHSNARVAGMLGLIGLGFLMTATTVSAEEKQPAARVLRHVVLLKFKPETTAAQITEIEEAFCALPKKIDTITDFEWGTDVAPEKRSEGFTHCFLVTFATEAGRDAYLPHPAHQEFVKLLKPQLDKVLVVDYWAKR